MSWARLEEREERVGFGFKGRDYCDEVEKIDPVDPWGEKECLAEVWETHNAKPRNPPLPISPI